MRIYLLQRIYLLNSINDKVLLNILLEGMDKLTGGLDNIDTTKINFT